MLKLKDEIDFEKLEDYNFEYDDKSGKYYITKSIGLCIKSININSWNRKINFMIDGSEIDFMNILFDLIQDGLVEKVEE